MLAEKFLLLLETLRSNSHDDDAPRVVSMSPHIAFDLGNADLHQTRWAEARRASESAGR
ncbi:MAG TPA: hypothetical protein VGL45_12925 [Bradyrhizobium sp.]